MDSYGEIKVGDMYASFDELKTQIDKYQIEKSVQLVQRDSRTLETAKKRVLLKAEKANKNLIYYNLTFCCVFGGKDYQCKSSGKRLNQRYNYLL